MITLEEIIGKIYPKKSLEELEIIFEFIANHAVSFEIRSWRMITKGDLANPKIQQRLVRTLFESQEGGEHGIVDVIFDSLEGWTDSYFLFADFEPELRKFYTAYYALASCVNFEWLGGGRQSYLLGGPFLAIMLAMGLDLDMHIRRYFSRFCFVGIIKDDTERFAQAIENNPSYIGVKPAGSTVAMWISDFAKLLVSSRQADASVENYLNTNSSYNKLNEVDKKVLSDILNIYKQIKTGAIWRDTKDFMCVHEKLEPGKIEQVKEMTQEDYYLSVLADAKEVTTWLQSYKEVAIWLQNKSVDFVKKLFKVLIKKVDLNDEKQVNLLVQFIEVLPTSHKKAFEGILYFSAIDNQFHWDEIKQ